VSENVIPLRRTGPKPPSRNDRCTTLMVARDGDRVVISVDTLTLAFDVDEARHLAQGLLARCRQIERED
jgi:hypothetical protein